MWKNKISLRFFVKSTIYYFCVCKYVVFTKYLSKNHAFHLICGNFLSWTKSLESRSFHVIFHSLRHTNRWFQLIFTQALGTRNDGFTLFFHSSLRHSNRWFHLIFYSGSKAPELMVLWTSSYLQETREFGFYIGKYFQFLWILTIWICTCSCTFAHAK